MPGMPPQAQQQQSQNPPDSGSVAGGRGGGGAAFKFLVVLFTRVPFANALTLLMLLSERAKRESEPPLAPKLIYVLVFSCVALGFAVSLNIRRRQALLIYCGLLLYMAYLTVTAPALGYKPWVRARLALPSLGCGAVFLHFAAISDCLAPSSAQLRQAGRSLLGVYAIGCAYAFASVPEEGEALRRNVSDSVPHLNWGLAALYSLAGMALLANYSYYGAVKLLACVVLAATLANDMRYNYWLYRVGMDFWCHARLLIDNLTVLLGLAIVLQRKRLV